MSYPKRPLGPVAKRVLRVVPHFGDESVSAADIAARLDLPLDTVGKALERAVKRGDVVRLRPGAYQLARGAA